MQRSKPTFNRPGLATRNVGLTLLIVYASRAGTAVCGFSRRWSFILPTRCRLPGALARKVTGTVRLRRSLPAPPSQPFQFRPARSSRRPRAEETYPANRGEFRAGAATRQGRKNVRAKSARVDEVFEMLVHVFE